MLSSLKTRLRRLIRGYQRSALYPVLLPHHRLTDTGVASLALPERALPEPVRRALSFCDGSNTVTEVAEAASASRSHIIAAQEGELILMWPRPVPATPPTVTDPARVTRIILSPHPDDAALSMGGAMLTAGTTNEASEAEPTDTTVNPVESSAGATERGATPASDNGEAPAKSAPADATEPSGPSVRPLNESATDAQDAAPAGQTVIVNVFTHSAWWRFNDGADAPDPAHRPAIDAIRRAEDDLVARLSNCPMRALDLDEALLRGHAMADIFTAEVGDRDAAAVAGVRDAVAALAAEFPNAEFALPMAIGRHVDHRLVRDAALAALTAAGAPLSRVRFYEDQPYAAKGESSDLPAARPELALAPHPIDITAQIDAKLELVRTYWSQFSWSQIPELKAAAADGPGKFVERMHGVVEAEPASR